MKLRVDKLAFGQMKNIYKEVQFSPKQLVDAELGAKVPDHSRPLEFQPPTNSQKYDT